MVPRLPCDGGITESYKFNLHVVSFDAHFNYNIDNYPHIELDVVFACFHLPSLVRTLGISTKLMAHSSKPTVPGVAHMLATCCSNAPTKYSINYIETSEANRVHTNAQLPKSCPFIIYVNYSCFFPEIGPLTVFLRGHFLFFLLFFWGN